MNQRAPQNEAELDDRLSEPTPEVADALAACPGDVVVVGAGGKMGPSLARMVRRAAGDGRRVIAVSRFTNDRAALDLESSGIAIHRADLARPDHVAALPDAPNVFFLAGQKFGTTGAPGATWTANVVVPALVANRYAGARIVALSTGNVYPLVPVTSGGAREDGPTGPVGEYAWSCLGRERVLEQAASSGTRVAIVRLNYAVDLRYGVLVDLALRLRAGQPIDLTMGHANVTWQGDACAQVIRCLTRASSPPWIVNVTGPEVLSIRAAAIQLARRLQVEPTFTGVESADALLSNTDRAQAAFGLPRVSANTLIEWVAEWVSRGGATLGKPTHFEQREGRF